MAKTSLIFDSWTF